MPATRDGLVKVVIQAAEKQIKKKYKKRKYVSCAVVLCAPAIGAAVGAGVGDKVNDGVGAGVGALLGVIVGMILGSAFAYLNRQKRLTVPQTLKALTNKRKEQLLEHYQNQIPLLCYETVYDAQLKEQLMEDDDTTDRTMTILKLYFETILQLDANKFAAF